MPIESCGAWSPDGSRIVCTASDTHARSPVVVIDILAGDAGDLGRIAIRRRSPVAEGNGAIWLDRHTLLVEAS